MLCHACHVHLRRDHPYCLRCGTLRAGVRIAEFEAPHLRHAGRAYPLDREVTTIGRAGDNDLVIDHPSVSRRHARVARTPAGYAVEDLGSFNGTGVADRTLFAASAVLPDSTELHIGDVPVRFEQPRSAAVGGRTEVWGTEHTALAPPPEQPATATEPLNVRPRRRGHWALKEVPGGGTWVLRNTRTGRYLELDDRDVFVWHLLDGRTTVRDLLFAFAEEYGELALPRIERTLHTLGAHEFVHGLHGQAPTRAAWRRWTRIELAITGLDAAFERAYRGFGWRFFTRTAMVVLWGLILVGLAGFAVASTRQRLFDTAGAGYPGAVGVALAYLVALVLHEAAHALAVKSYGRTVTRAGFMLMFGLPFAFVDTSDMWFGDRRSRLVVTLAGPLSTAALAGTAALGAAALPDPVASGLCYQLAFGLYLNTLYNLNPLLPLDGYQALADALRMPRLREESFGYLFSGAWLRTRPGRRELGLAGYAVAALLATAGIVLLALLAWRSRLAEFTQRYLPPPWGAIALGCVIMVALIPVWLRLGRRVAGVFR
ncbi:PqqD family peptide modification chaperone [Longispora sp. K20-0274]|uniref:PqqD family peptide modification chaperone n=1 Tax=Longispora sp. K20-0274 TaxID=3088255 RepID=UPI00399B2AC4